jgi:hypothetical protein
MTELAIAGVPRANPRANVDRLQATPSYARRLSSLVKCPLRLGVPNRVALAAVTHHSIK